MRTATITQDLRTNPPVAEGSEVRVEGLWHEITGGSWMTAQGNPAAMIYGMRSAFADLPTDDNVYYVKDDGGLGHLVHESELEFTDGE